MLIASARSHGLTFSCIVGISAGVASAAPADWPASKIYDASSGKLVSEAANPGDAWNVAEVGGTWVQTPPGSVGGLPAEFDNIGGAGLDGKLKYSTAGSGWVFTGGENVTTAMKWRVYIDPTTDSSRMPAVQIGNGVTRYRLDFRLNVAGEEGCELSGWLGAEDTAIEAGGRKVPNSPSERYLPMSVGEWHTIRFQVSPAGGGGSKFDVWLDEDEGGSDDHHASGTSTRSSGSTYLQWGCISTQDETTAWWTNYFAWGQDVPAMPEEIPDLPFAQSEDCGNNVDDDGDTLADCDDPGCDCTVPPPACGETTDIFEKFNVNFVPSAITGDVPPLWERAGYGPPAIADRDQAASQVWESIWDNAPYDPNPGPYYWLEPGPYQEERDQAYAECLANGLDADSDQCGCEGPIHLCDPGDASCCQLWTERIYHFTTPLRFELRFENIENDCGAVDDCYRGLIAIEREVKADDLAFLPIDWTQPVVITADSVATDLSPGGAGKWETFVTFAGYTGTESRIEWNDGSIMPSDYAPVSFTLDPNQANPGGTTTLVLGVDFDLVAQKLTLPNEQNQAFFENLRITYTADLTKPLIHLDKMAINHTILAGESLSSDTFTVTNGQEGTTLNYTIDDDASALWLTTSSSGGSSTGESDQVTINYDTASLLPGTYTGVITVDSPDINKSPATITITLVVISEHIVLSETEFMHLQVLAGSSLPNDTFTVTNGGGGTMTYSITDGAAWLSTSPSAGGPLGPSASDPIDVIYDLSSLGIGTHNTTIEVSSPEADNSPQSIAVTVEIIVTPPDFDGDGDGDQSDFGIFQACITGPPPASQATAGLCADFADYNGDGYVDQQDTTRFDDCANGPEVSIDPGCWGQP